MTVGIFSFATTSSAFITLASAKDSPKEIVYLETLVFSMFIRVLLILLRQ